LGKGRIREPDRDLVSHDVKLAAWYQSLEYHSNWKYLCYLREEGRKGKQRKHVEAGQQAGADFGEADTQDRTAEAEVNQAAGKSAVDDTRQEYMHS
jgi:hypothetical protein